MLIALGLATILSLTLLLVTEKISAVAGLILIPTFFALIGGAGGELGNMYLQGIKTVAPTAATFVFAILYFGVVTDAGLLDPVVRFIIRRVGSDPRRIAVGTAILCVLIHLDGAAAVCFLVTVNAMMPLYDRLGMDRRVLAAICGLAAGINILPWVAPVIRSAAVLNIPPIDIFRPLIIPAAVGILYLLIVAAYLGGKEKRRLGLSHMTPRVGVRRLAPFSVGGAVPVADLGIAGGGNAMLAHGGTVSGSVGHADIGKATRGGKHDSDTSVPGPGLPRLFWLNAALTLFILGMVISGIYEPAVMFMIGTAVVLVVNYPKPREQAERLAAHAKPALMMASILLASGVFAGILHGTGMLKAIAETAARDFPISLGHFIPLVTALISVPMSILFDPDSYYFGVLPIVSHMYASLGGNPVDVARASLMGMHTVGATLSPNTPVTFLLIGMTGITLGQYQKFFWKYALGGSFAMTIAAVLCGAIPL